MAPALPTTPENSFARRATLGSQLRFLAIRGLLGDDTLGLRWVGGWVGGWPSGLAVHVELPACLSETAVLAAVCDSCLWGGHRLAAPLQVC